MVKVGGPCPVGFGGFHKVLNNGLAVPHSQDGFARTRQQFLQRTSYSAGRTPLLVSLQYDSTLYVATLNDAITYMHRVIERWAGTHKKRRPQKQLLVPFLTHQTIPVRLVDRVWAAYAQAPQAVRNEVAQTLFNKAQATPFELNQATLN
ncbi:MAG: hypothetical protein KC475_11305 [Cyanobacteria bacterium HKST-UBA03]|nr:hypothetical protein [Cyanobacteria bacterium HKST-UBA03]